MHIGPEPTTDRFHVIMHGEADRELPGHALVSNPHSTFHDLSKFGNAFFCVLGRGRSRRRLG